MSQKIFDRLVKPIKAIFGPWRWKKTVEVDWHRQLIHEAGHAVASNALLERTADIVVMNYVNEKGVRQSHAKFKFDPGVVSPEIKPLDEQRIFEQVKVIAAGGLAESIAFGGEPDGWSGDLGKVNRLKFVLRTPSVRASIDAEVSAGFPETRELLQDRWLTVKSIADKAYSELQRLGLERANDFPETVVLPAAEVGRLFSGS